MAILILFMVALFFLPAVVVIVLPLLGLLAARFATKKNAAVVAHASRNGQAARTSHAQSLPVSTVRTGE